MHSETAAPCRFGCLGNGDFGGDSLRHYVLGCRLLFELMDVLMPLQVGPLTSLHRVGLMPCEPRRAAFLGHFYRSTTSMRQPVIADEMLALGRAIFRAKLV
jgi:hypothetical protein